ncbi:hypothetical protein HBB16_11615 [Pseudonocardia sp. MCCB 268]|nr:hypothetical protein [Pseudonocardia cytotoxica]
MIVTRTGCGQPGCTGRPRSASRSPPAAGERPRHVAQQAVMALPASEVLSIPFVVVCLTLAIRV